MTSASPMPFLHSTCALLWLSIAIATCLPAVAASCLRKCGDVDIPYPFGINNDQPGCALNSFNISCNDTGNGVHKPFIWDVELLNISLLQGQVKILMSISSYCYNTTSHDMDDPDEWSLDFTESPYRFSDTGNMFIVIGCQTLAYIGGDSMEDDVGKLTTGCAATCRQIDLTSLTDGACSGIGCCQMAIPKGLQYYEIWFDDRFNTTGIHNMSRCGYAALMAKSSLFEFSPTYLTSSAFNKSYSGQVPLVLDWAIGNETCEQAQQKTLDAYACKSSNSECLDSPNGSGYICNCSKGFQGNPYLRSENPESCQDIDECEHPEKYSCYGECRNKLGGFDCFCHVGSRGNPSIPGGCQKNFLTPKARLAIGVVACILSSLFGFLGWEVIRHKRSIKKQALLRQNDEFFQQHGGQLLLEMMKVEGNVGFTLYNRQEIETATNNFNQSHIVGEGGQGTVYRAVLDGAAVAIKRCKEIDESRKMEFMHELVILCRVNHPNIVKLLGCCLQFEVPMLVYEFVQNKTLQELLDLQRGMRFHVTLGTRLRIAAESADALAHLHSLPHPILHGDVKPANILLAEGLVAKMSDFGCSTIDEKTQAVPKGTPGYIDPDYLLEYQLTANNDVYSFGVILLELLTGKRPLSKERKSLTLMFKEAMADGTLVELLDSGIVDKASLRVIHQVAVVASQCLVVPGMTRPAMTLVAAELRRLALADEVQRCPQPPLVLEDLSFMEMGSTTSTWYGERKTSEAYSLEKKAVLSIEFAR